MSLEGIKIFPTPMHTCILHVHHTPTPPSHSLHTLGHTCTHIHISKYIHPHTLTPSHITLYAHIPSHTYTHYTHTHTHTHTHTGVVASHLPIQPSYRIGRNGSPISRTVTFSLWSLFLLSVAPSSTASSAGRPWSVPRRPVHPST